jgi:hypothetical protein
MPRIFAGLAFLFCFASSAVINIVVSVDWEGEEVSARDIKAMQEFRETFPDIKILHFLNAAYFTKPNADVTKLRKEIQSVLRPGDEHGLHIHGWKSLFEAAGVNYRNSPSFFGAAPRSICSVDCGHDIKISAYSVSELRKVIRYSTDLLQKQGFDRPRSFRAGGWMATKEVLQALSKEGLTLDSSALPAHHLDSSPSRHLQNLVKATWPSTEDTTQPYEMSFGSNKIVELPDNGCLADYMTPRQTLETVKKNVELWRQDQKREIYVTIGFHHESATTYLPRFTKTIELIKAYAAQKQLPIVFADLPLKLL